MSDSVLVSVIIVQAVIVLVEVALLVAILRNLRRVRAGTSDRHRMDLAAASVLLAVVTAGLTTWVWVAA